MSFQCIFLGTFIEKIFLKSLENVIFSYAEKLFALH